MGSQLILYKPELNPDVYFENTGVTYWNFGTGWTFGTNNTNGLGAEKLNVALSDLQLLVKDANDIYTLQVLRPFTTYKWTFRAEFCTNSGGGDSCTFQIGGVTVQTIPASGSYAIFTGVITTGATGTVLFRSTAGNSILLSWLNLVESPAEYDIDLTAEIDVPLNMAIADIIDPSKRDATFSRTVTLPATKENNKYFNAIYEISGEGTFNPNKKVKAIIINDGLIQFVGFSRLDKINMLGRGFNHYVAESYDITLFGELGDLFYNLKDTLISELDFSEYDHILSRTNQRNSWYTEIVRNGATYVNSVNGGFLTITSNQYNGGRVQMNFSGAHSLAVGDWILIPQGSIVNVDNPKQFYYGEHMVYSVVSSTAVVLQCPYYATAGDNLTTNAVGTNRVRKHSKTGEGYVYGMIDYDQNNGQEFLVNQLYPLIYVWEIIKKIGEKVGVTFESSHFDSVMFKKLVVNYNSGSLKLTQEQVTSRLFKAGSSTDQLLTFTLIPSPVATPGIYQAHVPNSTPAAIDVALDNDSTNGNFDNGGQFNVGTYKYVPNANGLYTLSGAFIAAWYWSQPGGVTQVNLAGYQLGVLQIEVYNYTTAQVVANCLAQHSVDPMPDNTQQGANFEITFSADNLLLVSGQSYGVRLRVVTPPNIQFYSGGLPYAGNITVNFGILGAPPTADFFKNEIKNTNVQIGDTVYMNSVLPKMKCTEFLTNIFKMFYLFADKDKINEKKYYVDPRDVFYANGTTKNWTKKLDRSQPIVIEPMGDLGGKIREYNYAEDSDFYNKDHKSLYGSVYGNKQHQIENDFKNDVYKTDITFGSTILVDLQGKIVSNIQGAAESGNQDPVASKLRILYFNCAGGLSTWYHTLVQGDFSEASTNNAASHFYPYVGHLDKPEAPYHDLNFWYPRGVYFSYDAWTDRNLFNLYYKKGVAETTNADAKKVTCYLHLSSYDNFTLDFRDTIEIDGHMLRLNRVGEFFVNKNVPTKVEFIKVNDMPPFVTEVGLSPGFGFSENEGFDYGLGVLANQGNGFRRGAGDNVIINGESQVGQNSFNVIVNGNGNNVGNSAAKIVISGNNNVVLPGLTDIVIVNSDGLTVTESGQSYLNGINVTNIQAKILRLST